MTFPGGVGAVGHARRQQRGQLGAVQRPERLFHHGVEWLAGQHRPDAQRRGGAEAVQAQCLPGLTGYPRLVHDPVTERDATDSCRRALDKFATSMWITPQPEDEEYLRRKLGLPERTAEDIQKQQEEKARRCPSRRPFSPFRHGRHARDACQRDAPVRALVEELAATRMQLAQLQDSQEAR